MIARYKIPVLLSLFILPVLITSKCVYFHEYPGFSKTGSGIYYRLNVLGEHDMSPLPGDYITVDIRYSTLNDSVFFAARRKFRLEKPAYAGSVEECFLMMNKGDEADFILNANNFFTRTLGVSPPRFIDEPDVFIISVKLIDIQSEQSFIKERESFLSWINDFSEFEKVKLQHFFSEEQLNAEPDSSGVYFISLNEARGRRVRYGDTIEIHYEGRFLYGRIFDSTRKREEAIRFVYGKESPLVRGLEKAVGLMHEGEKAFIIIPSDLAFGKTGSSTGIIPPYTSLIFEVEILSVI